MKTIKFIALIFLVGLLGSCNDATDIQQPGTLTDDVTFENVTDLQSGLNAVYTQYSNFDAINFNAVFADNVKNGISSNGQNQQLYNHVLNSTSSMASIVSSNTTVWRNRYATINYANRVLEAYEDMEIDDADDQQTADLIVGQLYGLRALAHLDLFEYYTEDYTADDALSVPIMDFVPKDVDYQPTRNTVKQVYDFISDDLDKGEALLGSSDLGAEYLSSDALEAMRARLELFRQNYDVAKTIASNLLAAHPLATPVEYKDVFTDDSDAGVIFKKREVKGDEEVAGLFYFNQVKLSGDPFVEMSNGLYNLLDTDDVRYTVLLKDPNTPGGEGSVIVGTDSPDNVLLINKYPGSGRGELINDVKIFRSAEMLLIKAEAEARLNEVPQAQASVQELLDNRYGTPPTVSYSNQTEALKGVLEQRRIELAYEGHRYLDIKRFRDALNIGISRNPVDCESYSATDCDLPKDDHRFTLPIPQAELNANGAITQNPGY